MDRRPAAPLRRIDPDRWATAPRGSATVWGTAGFALAFFACLLLTGCAQRENSTDDNRPGGFYGGVGGGMTRP